VNRDAAPAANAAAYAADAPEYRDGDPTDPAPAPKVARLTRRSGSVTGFAPERDPGAGDVRPRELCGMGRAPGTCAGDSVGDRPSAPVDFPPRGSDGGMRPGRMSGERVRGGAPVIDAGSSALVRADSGVAVRRPVAPVSAAVACDIGEGTVGDDVDVDPFSVGVVACSGDSSAGARGGVVGRAGGDGDRAVG